MARYLGLFEVDQTKIPLDLKERGNLWLMMANMVKQDMEKGVTKDWGAFVGETIGYFIADGTDAEVSMVCQQYVPYISFKLHRVITVGEAVDIFKTMADQ